MRDNRIIEFIKSLNCNTVQQFFEDVYSEDFIKYADSYFSIDRITALSILKEATVDIIMQIRLEEEGWQNMDIDKKIFQEFGKKRLYEYKKNSIRYSFNEFVRRKSCGQQL